MGSIVTYSKPLTKIKWVMQYDDYNMPSTYHNNAIINLASKRESEKKRRREAQANTGFVSLQKRWELHFG